MDSRLKCVNLESVNDLCCVKMPTNCYQRFCNSNQVNGFIECSFLLVLIDCNSVHLLSSASTLLDSGAAAGALAFSFASFANLSSATTLSL